MENLSFDVVVVGGGNAALCAALAAAEQGASVALLERAPEEKRGGNSKFTGGGFRMVHHGAQDIKRVVPDLSDADIARTDFGEYSAEEYLDDLGRITQYYIDPDLAEPLVRNSTDTVHWLMGRGVTFLPNYGRQAYNHEGRFKFFGGVVIYANGGGAGLVEAEYKAAAKHSVTIKYGARAEAIVRGKNGVEGQHSAGYRHSYPFGLMVNADGERFVDEGADFRNYTYAKYGRAVLAQPGSYAWQLFDAQALPLLRDEYKMRGATKVRADSLEELVNKMQDVNPAGVLKTIRESNAAVKRDVKFDPNIKDGKCTVGLAIEKSNWANTMEQPPFEAYSGGCGITFTFGGLKIDPTGHVLHIEDAPIPGPYAAGELVGGLFDFNYRGSAGRMAGAGFGRIAGRGAGEFALKR